MICEHLDFHSLKRCQSAFFNAIYQRAPARLSNVQYFYIYCENSNKIDY